MHDQKVRMTTQFLLPLPTRDSEANLPLKQLQRWREALEAKILECGDRDWGWEWGRKDINKGRENEQRKGLCGF